MTGRASVTLMLALLTSGLSVGPRVDAGCPDLWLVGADLPAGTLLEAVVRGPDRWVAVGRDGAAAVSEDGLHWTPSWLPAGAQGLAISWAPGVYVAVGSTGTYPSYAGVVMTSGDGMDWDAAAVPTTDYLGGIATDGGSFVAVGGGGLVLTSDDGSTWIQRSTPTDEDLHAIAYGSGEFVAVGHGGIILASSDGRVWHQRPSGAQASLVELATDGSIWLAAGSSELLRSTDGAIWTEVSTDVTASAVSFAAGSFLLITADGDVLISSDGLAWERSATLTRSTSGLSGNEDSVVAVGDTTFLSVDGRTWHSETPTAFPCLPGDIAWAGDRFIVTGCGVLTSPDGQVWSTTGGTADAVPTKIAQGEGGWVGVATSTGLDEWYGAVMTSRDGLDWSRVRLDYMRRYHDVAAGGDRFVVIGDQGTASFASGPFGFTMVSPDGEGWVVTADGLPDDLHAIAYGGGLFVVVGDGGTVLTSPDGYGWEQIPTPTDNDLLDVTFDGHRFIAVGTGGTVISGDGASSWQIHSTPASATLRAIAANRWCRVAVGRDGAMITSRNLDSWNMVPTDLADTLWVVGFGPPGFVAAGEHYLRGRGDDQSPMHPSPPEAAVD